MELNKHRPYSDLMNEIDHNGIKIVPLLHLFKKLMPHVEVEDYGLNTTSHDYSIVVYTKISRRIQSHYKVYFDEESKTISITHQELPNQLYCLQMLHEWGFIDFNKKEKI